MQWQPNLVDCHYFPNSRTQVLLHLLVYIKKIFSVQVLSTSVANALAYYDDPTTKTIVECFNVRSKSHMKKDDLKPYTYLARIQASCLGKKVWYPLFAHALNHPKSG